MRPGDPRVRGRRVCRRIGPTVTHSSGQQGSASRSELTFSIWPAMSDLTHSCIHCGTRIDPVVGHLSLEALALHDGAVASQRANRSLSATSRHTAINVLLASKEHVARDRDVHLLSRSRLAYLSWFLPVGLD